MNTIGSRINEYRLREKFSQGDLAKKVGVSRNAVSLWEADKTTPGIDRLRDLARHLRVPFELLATGERSSPSGQHSTGLLLLGSVAVGVWRETPTPQPQQELDMLTVPVAPDPSWPVDAQYCFRVEDDEGGMLAPRGSIVHCVDVEKARVQLRAGDTCIVERHRDGLVERTIKMLVAGKSGGLEALPPGLQPDGVRKAIPVGGDKARVTALVAYVQRRVDRGS